MSTLQNVLDLARLPLNDAKDAGGSDALCRTPDSELLTYALHGLLQAWRNRGDLFVGNYANPPQITWTAGQTFPLPDEFIQPIADYVTARAESKDDRAVLTGRAQAFYSLFGQVISA